MPRSFELIAGHPALDLVNTLDHRFRDTPTEELLDSYDDLLQFSLQTGLLTDRQEKKLRRLEVPPSERAQILAQTRQLREALALILYAKLEGRELSEPALTTLETFFQQAAQHRHIEIGEPPRHLPLTWTWRGLSREVAAPLWLLTQSAADLLFSDRATHIRSCGSETCHWLFLDTSKNHTRRWCDMKGCGNRMKARRFHAARSTSPLSQ